MKEVPFGIQHLESLKILDIHEMQKELVLNVQPNRGKDYWKVKKVAIVHFRYRIRGEHYKTYKLGELELFEHLQG